MTDNDVTTHNWGRAPHNRISFQNVQSLFPTARIRRGIGPIAEFGSVPREIENIAYEAEDGSARTVAQMLQSSYSDAFLVAKNGVILSEQYFNGMSADSLHLLNSISKSYVGLLAGVLVEQGCLAVDDLATKYLPELAGPAFQATTVRHLLDMTAAVKFGEDYADPNADFWVETAVVGWRPALVNDDSATSLLAYARSLQETDQRDGEKYHYRTVLTNVLGMVLERAAGRPLQDLLQSHIWSRLGPEQDAAIVVDSIGFPYVGAGMNACARDLARFGQMVVQQGSFNGEQVVPAEWINDTRYANEHAVTIFAASEYGEMMPGGHYRNKLWVMDAARGVLLAIGIHGQTIHMNMSTGVVVVKLSSHPESVDMTLFQDMFGAMGAISDTV